GVEPRKIGGAELLERALAQVLADVVQNVAVTLTTMRADIVGDPISLKSIQELPKGDLVWIDRGAALQLRNQLCAPNLCFTFRAPKAMPAALTPASHRIMVVKNDCPTAGRALADMAFHFLRLLFSKRR